MDPSGFDDLGWDVPQRSTTTSSPGRGALRSSKVRRTYGSRRKNDYSSSRDNSQKEFDDLFGEEMQNSSPSSSSFSSDIGGYQRASSSSLSATGSAFNIAASDPSTNSIASRRNVPPLRPSKKQHRRSISAFAPPPEMPKPRAIQRSSTNSQESSISGSFRSSDSSSLFGWKENTSPSELLDCGELSAPPMATRKIVRGRRRNSISAGAPFDPIKSDSSSTLPSFSSHSSTSVHSTSNRRAASSLLSRRNSMSNMTSSPIGGGALLFNFNRNHSVPIPRSSSTTLFNDGGVNDLAKRLSASSDSTSSPTKRPSSSLGEILDSASSPETYSVAASIGSCRKRGMNEEPGDEADDMSIFSVPRTSLANNTASRSFAARRYSPALDEFGGPSRFTPSPAFDRFSPMPMPGDDYYQGRRCSSAFELGQMSSSSGFELQMPSSFVPIGDIGLRKGGVMDIDSDREEPSDDDSFDDSMYEDSDIEPSPTKEVVSTVSIVRTEEDVLASMSSVEDLELLVEELQEFKMGRTKQTRKCASFGVFQYHLPSSWIADRRMAFVDWARNSLGFSIQSSSGARAYLEMKREQAHSKLKLLQASLNLQKKRIEEGTPVSNVNETPFILDTASNLGSQPKGASDLCQSDAADALLADLGSLSLKENDALISRRGSGTHASSIPLPPKSTRSNNRARLSIESCASADVDLTGFHLHGLSPAPPERRSKRAQKLSLCVNSFNSKSRQVESTPLNTDTAMASCSSASQQPTSFDFATPLMKQACQAWGSQPIPGKDWGCSEKCAENTLTSLFRKFQASLADADLLESSESSLFDPMSPFQATRSANVCLNLEDCADDDNGYDDSDDESIPATITKDMAMTSIDAGEHDSPSQLHARRRQKRMLLYKRQTVCALSQPSPGTYQRKSMFDGNVSLFDQVSQHRELSTPTWGDHHSAFMPQSVARKSSDKQRPLDEIVATKHILPQIFSFLEGPELLTTLSLVCSAWADASTEAYANMMLVSVGCSSDDEDNDCDIEIVDNNPVAQSMERSWNYLMKNFPFASFLGEGAFKRVYKVKNAALKAPEAVSIMDIDHLQANGYTTALGTELSVSIMLSSLARRGICPNFIVTRGVFTCPYEPPASHWGDADNKNHHVHITTPKGKRKPREPSAKKRGNFQYIRMELCTGGDAEEYIKAQPEQMVDVDTARILLFQISFALHAAASKFSLKHYDLKLLNVFLQDAANVPGANQSTTGDVVLRYGLGSHVFALKMPSNTALIAKLADYGTADVKSETTGQPVTMDRFTTFENTPPDFLILGDAAKQGHGHDLFGLGLCMLHLFTGKAPYEEILSDVRCPEFFKQSLRNLWENDNATGYNVIRTCIRDGMFVDDEGHYTGEPDETFYDSLYRFLVLFGIPKHKFQKKEHGKVWKAISDSFRNDGMKRGKDLARFQGDRRKYSLSNGTNHFIARARRNLLATEGAMELLMSLVTFDPDQRATALDVLNSDFFAALKERPGTRYEACDDVRDYSAFATV